MSIIKHDCYCITLLEFLSVMNYWLTKGDLLKIIEGWIRRKRDKGWIINKNQSISFEIFVKWNSQRCVYFQHSITWHRPRVHRPFPSLSLVSMFLFSSLEPPLHPLPPSHRCSCSFSFHSPCWNFPSRATIDKPLQSNTPTHPVAFSSAETRFQSNYEATIIQPSYLIMNFPIRIDPIYNW